MAADTITIKREALNGLIRAAQKAHDGLRERGDDGHGLTVCRSLERALRTAKSERARANSARAKESRRAKGANAK
jgi:hypothetical protein